MFSKIMKTFLAGSFIFSLLLISSYGVAQESYSDILSGYIRSGELSEAGKKLETELLQKADPLEDKILWDSLWESDTLPEIKIANALSIIHSLYPEGDPSRWDDVSGFWNPSQVPKSLAAVDAVYVAVLNLLEKPESSAHWLARDLFGALISSSRAKFYFVSQCPSEYIQIRERFESMSIRPPFGRWPDASVQGNLPLANPVMGIISENAAGSRGYFSLDAYGVPSSGGSFAWDREGGKLYRIRLSEGDGGFLSPRWQWRKDVLY